MKSKTALKKHLFVSKTSNFTKSLNKYFNPLPCLCSLVGKMFLKIFPWKMYSFNNNVCTRSKQSKFCPLKK